MAARNYTSDERLETGHASPAPTETPRVEGQSAEAIDVKLLQKAVGGDGRAFHELVDRHAQRLYRLAFSLVGNRADAEDVVQETFAGVFRGLKGFRGNSTVATWVTRILVTQAAKCRRDRKRHVSESIDSAEVNASVQGGAGGVSARIDLHAALQQVSPEHREVLVLREFEHLSYEEMAAVLNVPRGTIESRLHRARSELREKLESYRP